MSGKKRIKTGNQKWKTFSKAANQKQVGKSLININENDRATMGTVCRTAHHVISD